MLDDVVMNLDVYRSYILAVSLITTRIGPLRVEEYYLGGIGYTYLSWSLGAVLMIRGTAQEASLTR